MSSVVAGCSADVRLTLPQEALVWYLLSRRRHCCWRFSFCTLWRVTARCAAVKVRLLRWIRLWARTGLCKGGLVKCGVHRLGVLVETRLTRFDAILDDGRACVPPIKTGSRILSGPEAVLSFLVLQSIHGVFLRCGESGATKGDQAGPRRRRNAQICCLAIVRSQVLTARCEALHFSPERAQSLSLCLRSCPATAAGREARRTHGPPSRPLLCAGHGMWRRPAVTPRAYSAGPHSSTLLHV